MTVHRSKYLSLHPRMLVVSSCRRRGTTALLHPSEGDSTTHAKVKQVHPSRLSVIRNMVAYERAVLRLADTTSMWQRTPNTPKSRRNGALRTARFCEARGTLMLLRQANSGVRLCLNRMAAMQLRAYWPPGCCLTTERRGVLHEVDSNEACGLGVHACPGRHTYFLRET
jgi:hypothetical protein